MEKKSIVESFNVSIQGLLYALKTQRNMRLHITFAFVFVVAGLLFLERVDFLILTLVITFLLIAEMINTALGIIGDLVEERFHKLARIAKDIAAGAVLIASLSAVLIGYILFMRPGVIMEIENGLARLRESSWHFSFLALMLVLSITVAIKVLFHKGKPLSGGMPSVHSAVIFSAWTLVTFFSRDALVVALTLVMAVMVAHSRIIAGLHNIWEVLSGSTLGILMTVLLLRVLGIG